MEMAKEIAFELSSYALDPGDRSFMDEYVSRSVVLLKEVTMIKGDEKTFGQVVGFDGDGGLLLKTGEQVRLFTGGEVSLRLDGN